MAKQTMGTPAHALDYRSDNKLYRILTPQTPMVRPYKHDHYGMDEYPLGTNAVVAVLSYTVSSICRHRSAAKLEMAQQPKSSLQKLWNK
jgi:hypothetical protein